MSHKNNDKGKLIMKIFKNGILQQLLLVIKSGGGGGSGVSSERQSHREF